MEIWTTSFGRVLSLLLNHLETESVDLRVAPLSFSPSPSCHFAFQISKTFLI